ncbi:MAG: ABC transporter permease [Deltaproteobacteria bacterium]|nr:ABC transporter permease [Deltaproteobacteria bacterium]
MIRLALRNIIRNRWRSGLTVAGIAVAVAMLIWSESMFEAFIDVMVVSTTNQLGDIRLETEDHAKESTIYEAFFANDNLLADINEANGVRAAAPRLYSFGLLGNEKHSQAALIIGIDSKAETRVSDLHEKIIAGSFMPTDKKDPATIGKDIILGDALAKLLSVKVGDELVGFLQAANGSMSDDKMHVIGIVHTGISQLDRQAAWMRITDVAYLTALDGQVHEIIVRINKGDDLNKTAAALRQSIAKDNDEKIIVRTWEQLAPDLSQMMDVSRLSMWVLYGIVFFIAALGILNTQRMTALERKRELAVMMAVGATPQYMVILIVLETIILTGLGAIAGSLLGWGASAYHAHFGLNMAAFGSESYTYQGVEFTSHLYFVLKIEMIFKPALSILLVALLCALWPAITSARLHLSHTIAGRS